MTKFGQFLGADAGAGSLDEERGASLASTRSLLSSASFKFLSLFSWLLNVSLGAGEPLLGWRPGNCLSVVVLELFLRRPNTFLTTPLADTLRLQNVTLCFTRPVGDLFTGLSSVDALSSWQWPSCRLGFNQF